MSQSTKVLHNLHAALMPDYNRAAATYWWGLIFLGASVIAVATYEASLRPLPSQLQIVAAFSIGVTGWIFLQLANALESRQLYSEVTLLGLLPATAIVHFLLTGWLVRMVLHLKAEKPLRLRVLLGSFGWIGSTYAANAFIAALL